MALEGKPAINDMNSISTDSLFMLNIFDIILVILFGIIFILLQFIRMSDSINIGNIDGTRVLNHIQNDVIIVFDTSSLFNKININIINVIITITKLEYFFIV